MECVFSVNGQAVVEQGTGWLACSAEQGAALLLLVMYAIDMWTQWGPRQLMEIAARPHHCPAVGQAAGAAAIAMSWRGPHCVHISTEYTTSSSKAAPCSVLHARNLVACSTTAWQFTLNTHIISCNAASARMENASGCTTA